MNLQELANELRRQADELDGDYGPHVYGMRAGLLLAAVETQHAATEAATRVLKDYLT